MKILALDSSAVTASVALSEDEKILASAFVNNGLTHSQTLLPMVEQVLRQAHCAIGEVDLIAVANGPGSFTGVRIGVSVAKGLAFAHHIPCLGISTLELIAANIDTPGATVISCMDARRAQVYTAAFESVTLNRLCEDKAASIESLADFIRACEKPVYLCGDGARLAYGILSPLCKNVMLPENEKIYQNATKLCKLAYRDRHKAVDAAALLPTYLRMSQAERELKRRR